MIDDKVTVLDCVTRLDIPVDRILRGASDAAVQDAVVIGWTKDGDFYFASSRADGGNVIYLLELAKKKLLEIGDA